MQGWDNVVEENSSRTVGTQTLLTVTPSHLDEDASTEYMVLATRKCQTIIKRAQARPQEALNYELRYVPFGEISKRCQSIYALAAKEGPKKKRYFALSDYPEMIDADTQVKTSDILFHVMRNPLPPINEAGSFYSEHPEYESSGMQTMLGVRPHILGEYELATITVGEKIQTSSTLITNGGYTVMGRAHSLEENITHPSIDPMKRAVIIQKSSEQKHDYFMTLSRPSN